MTPWFHVCEAPNRLENVEPLSKLGEPLALHDGERVCADL